MPRPVPWHKRLRWYLELAALRALMALFAVLPLEWASALGGWLMRRLGPLLPVQRLARGNLRLALPELDRAGQDRLLRAMWDNLGRTGGEYPHLPELVAEASARIDYDLHPDFLAHTEADSARILASAHFANWEVMHIAAANWGLDTATVVRQPNNPLVVAMLESWRAVAGGTRIRKGKEGARQTVEAVKAGKTLAILIDQRMSEGVEVRFFGHPAMTPNAPAELSLRFGAPIFPARLERLPGPRFRVTVGAPLRAPEGVPRAEAALALTQALNDRLEGWIREKPEDWLWLHRRWPKELYRDL
jgi:KDO2-lipid IV(A) lauroyltransferase